jgi:hypothetical protein
LRKLLEEKKTRIEMGEMGKKFSSEFTWDNMARGLYD